MQSERYSTTYYELPSISWTLASTLSRPMHIPCHPLHLRNKLALLLFEYHEMDAIEAVAHSPKQRKRKYKWCVCSIILNMSTRFWTFREPASRGIRDTYNNKTPGINNSSGIERYRPPNVARKWNFLLIYDRHTNIRRGAGANYCAWSGPDESSGSSVATIAFGLSNGCSARGT